MDAEMDFNPDNKIGMTLAEIIEMNKHKRGTSVASNSSHGSKRSRRSHGSQRSWHSRKSYKSYKTLYNGSHHTLKSQRSQRSQHSRHSRRAWMMQQQMKYVHPHYAPSIRLKNSDGGGQLYVSTNSALIGRNMFRHRMEVKAQNAALKRSFLSRSRMTAAEQQGTFIHTPNGIQRVHLSQRRRGRRRRNHFSEIADVLDGSDVAISSLVQSPVFKETLREVLVDMVHPALADASRGRIPPLVDSMDRMVPPLVDSLDRIPPLVDSNRGNVPHRVDANIRRTPPHMYSNVGRITPHADSDGGRIPPLMDSNCRRITPHMDSNGRRITPHMDSNGRRITPHMDSNGRRITPHATPMDITIMETETDDLLPPAGDSKDFQFDLRFDDNQIDFSSIPSPSIYN